MRRWGRIVLAAALLLPLAGVVAWLGIRAGGVREDGAEVLAVLRAEVAGRLPEAAAVGAVRRTAVERYGPDTLVDWIDGAAETLLGAGLREARVASYVFPGGTEAEVAALAFVSAQRAHAWFALQRPQDARWLDERGDAWVAPDAGGAVRGTVALQVLVMVPGDTAEAAVEGVVRAWAGSGGG